MLINKTENIFIAGASGMVGSAIIRKLNEFGYINLKCPSRYELDLTDTEMVSSWFKKK